MTHRQSSTHLKFRGVLSLLVLASLMSSGKAGEQWPQWRGPQRDGKIGLETKWPASLDKQALQQVWSHPLSPSYSGPIISDDKVFVTETVEKKKEVVTAFERETGEQIWQTEWPGALAVPFFAWANGSWIRSTPALADGVLYVAGMQDLLVALDAETGEELWRYSFPQKLETPEPAFGFVCSPLVKDGFVYVQAGAGFCKLNAKTGDLLWRVLQDEGGMGGSAFASPYFCEIAGQPQILVQTRTKLAGVDAKTGEVFWTQDVPAFRGMNILTPTVVGNRIFTSTYGNGCFLYEVKNEDGFKVEEVWTNNQQGYMSSPVIEKGFAYLHLKNQRVTCLDLQTGESTWTTKPFGKYWSLISNGEQLLALDETGQLLLVAVNSEEFQILDQRKVSDSSTWAHLAIAGDLVVIRSLDAVTAYRWK